MVQGLQSSINRCPPAPSGMNSMQCMCNVHVHVHSRSCACACGVHVHVHVHVHVCACASGCLQNFLSQFQGFQGPIALFFRVPIFTTALSISDRCEFSLLMNMTKMNNQCDDKAIFRVVRVPMKKGNIRGFQGLIYSNHSYTLTSSREQKRYHQMENQCPQLFIRPYASRLFRNNNNNNNCIVTIVTQLSQYVG